MLTTRRILSTWWPLAASWLMMSLELPLVSAVMARLPDPQVALAAYGGVVFPLALIIEAPVIMLLAASTALCKDWASYVLLRRFAYGTAWIMTGIHLLIVATPLFDLVVGGILGVPEAVRDPSRMGLLIMLPWTGAIAYRRFQQGVLIRYGHSKAVGIGTAVRLAGNVTTLVVGALATSLPAIVVGTAAVSVGVTAEAVFIGFWVRPVLRDRLRPAPPLEQTLTWNRMLAFYVPLALTSMIQLIAHPIGSAGISRMPVPLESLAVWPVVTGLAFVFRCFGFAYNEVVVSLLDQPGAAKALRRFTLGLVQVMTLAFLALAATPLGWGWFRGASGLDPELARLGASSLWIALPLPALAVLHSWYQGSLVHAHRTRAVTESVLLGLILNIAVLGVGVIGQRWTGLYVMIAAMTVGGTGMVLWLRWRCRSLERY